MEISANVQKAVDTLSLLPPIEARQFAIIIRHNKKYAYVRKIMFGFTKKASAPKTTTKANK